MGTEHPTSSTSFLLVTLTILSISSLQLTIARETQSSRLSKLYKAKYYHGNGTVNKRSLLHNVDKLDNHEHMINHHYGYRHKKQRHYHTDHTNERSRDRIDKLPGQPPVNFTQYGGYVTVDSKAGRALYYYFVEADRPNKSSLPLLLWLNGGPGCSSLAYGAMEELGPFRVHSDGKTLFRNKFAWNRAANVLFLESPAGVGFSYSNRTSDYDTFGDRKTSIDNFVFLLKWLDRFPEYKGREFYISGESYAGHYVPQLANLILQHNVKAKKNSINLKGILIGNAVINDETDIKGMYEYFWTHALISDQVKNQIMKHCDFSPNAITQNDECNSASDAVDLDIEYLDIYNIYAPVCLSSDLTRKPKKHSQVLDPCSDNYVSEYMNNLEVQKALHANITKLDHTWLPCSEIITKWGDSPSTVIPLLKKFMANGLRVWIFSGDTDGMIPVTSTKASVNEMKLAIKTQWHPWYIKAEVGGYTQEYEGNLTFATVRGAGHQVPSFQPLRALSLIKHFLSGTPLPNTKRTKYLYH